MIAVQIAGYVLDSLFLCMLDVLLELVFSKCKVRWCQSCMFFFCPSAADAQGGGGQENLRCHRFFVPLPSWGGGGKGPKKISPPNV